MRTKSVLLIALTSLCVAGAFYLSVAAFSAARSFVRIWRGYYTVLVSDGRPVAEVQRRLHEDGLTVTSAVDSLVAFNDFSGEVSVSINRLPARLDRLDPRYDPYMKAVAGYFHQGRWNIFYVKSTLPTPIFYAVLARALHGYRWRIADFNWRATLLSTAFLLLVALFIVFRTRRPHAATVTLLAGGLPWLASAVNGNYIAVLAGTLLWIGWSAIVDLGYPLLRYYLGFRLLDRGRLKPLGGITLAMLFAGAVLTAAEQGMLSWLIDGVGATLLLSSALLLFEVWKHGGRRHQLFFPIKITDGARSLSMLLPRVSAAAWIVLVLLASPAIAFKDWHGDVEIPTPVVYPGIAHDSWGGLRKVWGFRTDRRLPTLADYVAHRAFQTGLPYGVKYALPSPGERVFEAFYRRDGGRITTKQVTVKTYSVKWFREVLSRGGKIVRLIERQPGMVVPVKRKIYDVGYPISYLPVFWLVALAVWFPAAFVRQRNGFETIGTLGSAVSTFTATAEPQPLRLPEGPGRKRRVIRANGRSRNLVPNAVGEVDR